ncbi:MAG: hypothetical protein A4E49_00255 [Methanosaeta sp. PtaU1.Bin112]|nr:MAG: hypothetical protein A4E49_00255 [Methanosaeta sp. PtaU1.Bin112]
MSDYLSSIAARSLSQVKVILPRVTSRYEPMAASGFAISPFTDQGDLRGSKAFMGENDDSFGYDLETETFQSSRSTRDHHSLPRPLALRRAVKFSVNQADEKSPLTDTSLKQERGRRSSMNRHEPVPIRSRKLQSDINPARSDHSSIIAARQRDVPFPHAALIGSSRNGASPSEKVDLKGNDSSDSSLASFHAFAGDIKHQAKQTDLEMDVLGASPDRGSKVGAKIAVEQRQCPEGGLWEERKRDAPIKDRSTGNLVNSEAMPIDDTKSARFKTIGTGPRDRDSNVQAKGIPDKASTERVIAEPSYSLDRAAQKADTGHFWSGYPERRESKIRVKVVSPQIIADAIEHGSMNPDHRVEGPNIHVTIGRIEIRATPPLATTQPRRTSPNTMSLNEYLRQRAGGDGK